MGQCKRITAIGCTVFSVTKPHAHAIGLAGMERLLSSCVLEVFCTMKMPIRVIGPKMLMDAKNIVSQMATSIHIETHWLKCIPSIVLFCLSRFSSSLQWRCKWQCSIRKIMQSLLAMPRRLSTFATMPCNARIRSTITAMRCPTHWRLRCAHDTNTTRRWSTGQWTTARSRKWQRRITRSTAIRRKWRRWRCTTSTAKHTQS